MNIAIAMSIGFTAILIGFTESYTSSFKSFSYPKLV
jgi:hypothetical protein